MTQEYELIREGLLALLCVGDKIFRIHPITGAFDLKTKEHTRYHTIAESTVIKFDENDNTLQIISNTGFKEWVDKSRIEAYEGRLYAWNFVDRYYETKHEGKVDEMIKIIKSDQTVFEDF